MYTLTADTTKPAIYSQQEVSCAYGLKKQKYCNLAMYPATVGGNSRILICTVNCKMVFKNGLSKQKATLNQPLVWADAEKKSFMTNFVAVIKKLWDFQWPLIYEPYTVAVQFDISATEVPSIDTHYTVNVTKSDAWVQSYVQGSTAELDTGDVTGANKGAKVPQRAAAHEFGHMMSYEDEYKTTGYVANTQHLADKESIMHSGESHRERHYVFFAVWIEDQCVLDHPAPLGPVTSPDFAINLPPPIVRVNGTTILDNAGLLPPKTGP